MDGSATRDRRRTGTVRRLLSATVGLIAMVFLVAPPAGALALPTPAQLVSNLDLECFKTSPYQPLDRRAGAAAHQPGARRPAHRAGLPRRA
ncbi:hypothetical protein ACFSTC_38890 [Nonomuraea ferruginea]